MTIDFKPKPGTPAQTPTDDVHPRVVSGKGDLAERRRVSSIRAFYVAAAALAVSTVLPWAVVLGVAGIHPTGGAVAYVLAFAGVYAAGAHLVRTRKVTRSLLNGAWVVNAWMVLNVITIFSALGKGGGVVSPGAGVYIASLGVVAGIAATVQLHRAGPQRASWAGGETS